MMGKFEVLCSLLFIALIAPCGGLMCYRCAWFRDATSQDGHTPACLEEDQLMNVPSLLVTCEEEATLCSTSLYVAGGGDIQVLVRDCMQTCSTISPYTVECCYTDGCVPAVTGSVPTVTPSGGETTTPTAAPTTTPTLPPTAPQTDSPTTTPTAVVPTDTPTVLPTDTPTVLPTDTPTVLPTDTEPTMTPTEPSGTTPSTTSTSTTATTTTTVLTTTPTESVDGGGTTTPTVPSVFITPTAPIVDGGSTSNTTAADNATVPSWTTPTTPGDGATEGVLWTTPGDGTTAGPTDGEYLECYVCAWYQNPTDDNPQIGNDCRDESEVRQDAELRVRCEAGYDRCQVAVTNDDDGAVVSVIRACSTADSCQGDDASVDYTCCTTHGCNDEFVDTTREPDSSASSYSNVWPLLVLLFAVIYYL